MLKNLLVVLLILVFSQIAFAQKSTPIVQPTLDERIKAEMQSFSGKVWIYAKNLDTGKD
jgi:hypothetical protein